MKKKILKSKKKVYKVKYREKKPLVSPKEIIYRSPNRIKVLTFSPRFQIIVLSLFGVFFFACVYAYYVYSKSGGIILDKEREIESTKGAYVELVSDIAALHKNMKPTKALEEQALLVEDKIKGLTDEKAWINNKDLSDKITLNEAVLQRDLAKSERDILKKQIDDLEKIIKEIKAAELEVLEKVEQIASKEISKIKSSLNSINEPLKKRGLYFNILANSKKAGGKGGAYIPDRKYIANDKQIDAKINKIFETADNIDYYKEAIKYVPIGKPVWSYWVTSHYGSRADPFKGTKATHKGVDLASRTGNKIRIKAKGKVTKAEYSGAYGNLVVVDHENGFVTKYAHMNKIYVKKGQRVEFDEVLGEVGSTGRSTGPHLHYEVSYLGVDVNPINFVKAKY